MNTSIDLSWIPPDASYLRFNNCMLTVEFAIANWPNQQLPIVPTIELIKNGLTSYLDEKNRTMPADWEILRWISNQTDNPDSELVHAINVFTYQECVDEVCPHLGWSGNADLLGTGMFANYILQAAFATIDFVVLRIDRHSKLIPRRFVEAIEYSTRTFLDSAILFSFSMIAAAYHTLSWDDKMSNYTAALTAFLSLYSLIPVMLLHVSVGAKLRRRRIRLFLWAVSAILAIILLSLYVYVWDAFDNHRMEDPDGKLLWDSVCISTYNILKIDIFMKMFAGVMLTAWLIYVVSTFCTTGHKRGRKLVFPSCIQPHLRRIKNVFIGMALLGMWACILYFSHVRTKFRERGGDSNEDFDLSFGQFLALATWVPVVVEFIYIFKEGPVEGLTGQLMKPYVAVESAALQHQEQDNNRSGEKEKPVLPTTEAPEQDERNERNDL